MSDLPSITIVTPCRNAVRTLGATFQSIINQSYPELEYIVSDAESTDGTLEVIRSFEGHFKAWRSAPDRGPYDAINRMFAESQGDIMGWLNADDILLPGCLATIADIFVSFPDVEWISTLHPLTIDGGGKLRNCRIIPGFSSEAFANGEYCSGGNYGWIQQESTFWRRSLWKRAGAMLELSYSLAADFALWSRFFHHAVLYGVTTPLAAFRRLPQQRSRDAQGYELECRTILSGWTSPKKSRQLATVPVLGRLTRPSWAYHGQNLRTAWDENQKPRWAISEATF